MAPAVAIVGRHLQSFQDFPPRQQPGSFTIGQAMGTASVRRGRRLTPAAALCRLALLGGTAVAPGRR